MLYYELLQPNQTINAERYRQQLLNLNQAFKEKRSQYAMRKLFFSTLDRMLQNQ